jgi:uncharacterized protein YggE
MLQILKLTLGVVLVAAWVLAQDHQHSRPLVTVYGTADMKVLPDVVDISIGIETRGKDLASAFEQQTGRITNAIALIRKAGVDVKDIQTDFSSITPSTATPRTVGMSTTTSCARE